MRLQDVVLPALVPGFPMSWSSYDILRGEGKQPEVVVDLGTNNIGRKREVLMKFCKMIIGRSAKG